jgi:hypothetical protein
MNLTRLFLFAGLLLLFVLKAFGFNSSQAQGKYLAVSGTTAAEPGLITFNLSARGTYTGSLQTQGKRFSFSGSVLEDGSAHKAIRLSSDVLATLDLYLADESGENFYAYLGSDSADFQQRGFYGGRSYFDKRARPAVGYSGKYTMIIPGNAPGPELPRGDSYVTFAVDLGGTVKATGKFEDGTAFTRSSFLFQNGHYAFFHSGSGGISSAAGMLQFAGGPSGTLTWIRHAQAGAAQYPNGFVFQTDVLGSPYTPPARGRGVIELAAASLVLQGIGLPAPFPVKNDVTLTAANRVIHNGPNAFSISVRADSGIFSGKMTPLGGPGAVTLQGVFLQNRTNASGYFAANSLSGRVVIQ